MARQITVYYDSEGPDLKVLIARLAKRRESPYFKRSESAIAAMLLQERLEQVLDAGQADAPKGRTGIAKGKTAR